MNRQLSLTDYITGLKPTDKDFVYIPQEDEGWYQVALFHYPTKESLDIGKAVGEQTMIYAKTILSAKQQASKWAKKIRGEWGLKYPIDENWEEVKNSKNQYGIHWEKHGSYYSCNPKLFLIPNNIVSKNTEFLS